jgi:hypothetical protein
MAEAYKQRNRIERAVGKAKQFCRFATTYEKLRDVYLGVVRLVFGFINAKRLARSVNTPYNRSGISACRMNEARRSGRLFRTDSSSHSRNRSPVVLSAA